MREASTGGDVTVAPIRTPDQRLRVFVSSTLGELADERRAARASVEQLRLAPVMFELGARPHPPRALYRAYLAQSDVFVGIYWQRYGWVAPGMEISGLEDELVLSKGMPRLVYVKRPAPEIEPRLAEMLGTLQDEDAVSYKPFTDAAELHELLLDDLALLLTERFDRGRAAGSPRHELRHNLPAQTSTFLGREALLADLRKLLESPSTRLVTLTGPGGTGKTRLALEVAGRLVERFDDGVFFVDLSREREVDGVFAAVARAANVAGAADVPPLEALEQALRDSRMLVVLDNVEQVTDAGPALVELLAHCARLVAVVTSRAALRVRGEHVFAVPPLSLPPDGGAGGMQAALASEAVQLFSERAAALTDFSITGGNVATVVDICRRLDGLPLAIELAAARVGLFGLEDLRAGLEKRLDLLRGGARDLPARQQTLRNAIEWSHDLLTDDERAVFRFLSVFDGAHLLDVERTAARLPALAATDVIETLGSLVDKSLVRSSPGADGRPRFSMLQTIRSYATEKLDATPDVAAAARHAHADHYTELALELHGRQTTSERADLLAALSSELGNFREAWAYWASIAEVSRLVELLEPLWGYYEARGDYRAATELGEELLGVLAAKPETPERLRDEQALLMNLARTRMAIHGFTPAAEESFRRALRRAEAAGDAPRRFSALRSLTSLHMMRADFARSAEVAKEVMAVAEEQRDPTMLAEAHLVVGTTGSWLSDLPAAVDHVERSIAYFDEPGSGTLQFRVGPHPGVVANVVGGLLQFLTGFPDRARERIERALATAAALDHPYSMAYALHHGAVLELWCGDVAAVATRADELRRIADAHDYGIWHALALVLGGTARIASGQVDGLAELEEGFARYEGLVTPPVFWPALLMIRAQAFALAGRREGGLAFIEMAEASLHGDDPFGPDVALAHGDFLRDGTPADVTRAEEHYRAALALARARGARMLELQALTRLATLHADERDRSARDALRAVYETFTEGFDTRPLAEARSALDGN